MCHYFFAISAYEELRIIIQRVRLWVAIFIFFWEYVFQHLILFEWSLNHRCHIKLGLLTRSPDHMAKFCMRLPLVWNYLVLIIPRSFYQPALTYWLRATWKSLLYPIPRLERFICNYVQRRFVFSIRYVYSSHIATLNLYPQYIIFILIFFFETSHGQPAVRVCVQPVWSSWMTR